MRGQGLLAGLAGIAVRDLGRHVVVRQARHMAREHRQSRVAVLVAPGWVARPCARGCCLVGQVVCPAGEVFRRQIGVLQAAMVVGVRHAGCPDQALGHRGPGAHEAGVPAMIHACRARAGRVPFEDDLVVADDDDVAGLADLERVELLAAQSGDGSGDAHALIGGGVRSPLECRCLVTKHRAGERQREK